MTNTMDDEELLNKARSLLWAAKLSGASIEFLEAVIEDGFADAGLEPWGSWDEDLAEQGRSERSRIRELCLLHHIL
jgi:hypothetical protein